MNNDKKIMWILRIAVAGEFLGHGMFGILHKEEWIGWVQSLLGVDLALATTIIFLVGIMDVALAVLVLVKPMRPLLLWMAFWGFWTAILRPIMGKPIWDFVERLANAGAPLALYYLMKKE
ncbi:MAG: hypothetical protein QG583_45 [Patescibacteria group bacterium]|nr:hypothetical protein [Patescibacteria group bacterium]